MTLIIINMCFFYLKFMGIHIVNEMLGVNLGVKNSRISR